MSFKLYSDLSEKQIEADVATYFGWITPRGRNAPFRLLDIDEQLTGADKLFDQVIPIYMQFKVSEGLTKLPNGFLSRDLPFPFQLSPLKRIRTFRSRESLFDNPTLYFKLRAKAKTATDFQHNILSKLANTGNSHAFYVAPLTLSKSRYEETLFSSTDRFLDYPFHFIDGIEIRQERWSSYLGLVPFLRAHVSIVPHENVSTDEHYYSFSPNGTDIAWHSPRLIGSRISRLSDMMQQIFHTAFSGGINNWITPREFLSLIANMDRQNIDEQPSSVNDDNYGINQLINFGRRLYEEFQIRQLLLLTTKEFLIQLNG